MLATDIHADLPISRLLTSACDYFHSGQDLIISATPGAGKSTVLPLALLEATDGKLLLVQPRRVAAVGVAKRMATLLGEPCPGTIGYRTRPETRISPQTRIEVITEGIFLRMLQADPALTDYSAVLLDECHERSCNLDLALALLGDCRDALRDDLRLVLMSATLDTETFQAALPNAHVLSCETAMHPVETVYQAAENWQATTAETARAVSTALTQSPGDVLVFLPGRAEINRACDYLLSSTLATDVEIVQLHGSLAVDEQDRIAHPPQRLKRRVILSTAISETSLTIDGVTSVVDAGLARREVFDVAAGMNRLTTTRASEASATQRQGRAGRTAPGFCVRLWSAHERRHPHTTPEISETGLPSLCLELALWGTPDPAELRWLTPPPGAAVAQAQALLRQLGLTDHNNRITAHGRAAGKLGTEPRLASMLLHATASMREQACLLAALLSEGATRHCGSDDLERLLNKSSGTLAISKRVRQTARQFMQRLPECVGKADSLAQLLGLAYPERIALQRRAGSGEYLLSQGSGASLAAESDLFGQPALVVADLTRRKDGTLIRSAVAINRSTLADAFPHLISESDELVFDESGERFEQRYQQCLGALVLHEKRTPPNTSADMTPALLDWVQRKGEQAITWTDDCTQLCARTAFIHAHGLSEAIPRLDKAALLSQAEDWLEPFLNGVRSIKALRSVDLAMALKSHIGWSALPELDRLAPAAYTLPTGKRVDIDYARPEQPAIEARIQELFSLTTHPTLGEGLVPLQVHLLSPARRPVQVTADLPGFWRGSYADVRKEMKGRYPKHHWPEDPANTLPHSSVRPQHT